MPAPSPGLGLQGPPSLPRAAVRSALPATPSTFLAAAPPGQCGRSPTWRTLPPPPPPVESGLPGEAPSGTRAGRRSGPWTAPLPSPARVFGARTGEATRRIPRPDFLAGGRPPLPCAPRFLSPLSTPEPGRLSEIQAVVSIRPPPGAWRGRTGEGVSRGREQKVGRIACRGKGIWCRPCQRVGISQLSFNHGQQVQKAPADPSGAGPAPTQDSGQHELLEKQSHQISWPEAHTPSLQAGTKVKIIKLPSWSGLCVVMFVSRREGVTGHTGMFLGTRWGRRKDR